MSEVVNIDVTLTSTLSSPTNSPVTALSRVNLNSVGISSARRAAQPSICSRRLRSHFKSSTQQSYSLTVARLLLCKDDFVSPGLLCAGSIPWHVWESLSEQMRATVCQLLMPPGMWCFLNYQHCLLSGGTGIVWSWHVSQLNGCLIYQLAQFTSVQVHGEFVEVHLQEVEEVINQNSSFWYNIILSHATCCSVGTDEV